MDPFIFSLRRYVVSAGLFETSEGCSRFRGIVLAPLTVVPGTRRRHYPARLPVGMDPQFPLRIGAARR